MQGWVTLPCLSSNRDLGPVALTLGMDRILSSLPHTHGGKNQNVPYAVLELFILLSLNPCVHDFLISYVKEWEVHVLLQEHAQEGWVEQGQA